MTTVSAYVEHSVPIRCPPTTFECVGMCRYDDANVLFYACSFARRQMPWSSLQGFVRTAGCTLRRRCLPEVGLLHLHHVLTGDACADAL